MAGGRPVKLTDSLQKQITDVIRAGNYIETAASFAGVHKSTLYDWLKRGALERQRVEATGKKPQKRELPFLEFSDAVEKALAESEVRDVTRVGEASKSDWKAAAWRLERKFPKKWGKKFQQISNDEERDLKLELLRMQLEKAKLEIKTISGEAENDAHDKIVEYTKALTGNAADYFRFEGGDGIEEED